VIIQVVLARTSTGERVAVKSAAQGKEATLAQEAFIHAELVHPNIVRLRSVVTEPSAPVHSLVLDFCPGGTLAEAMEGIAACRRAAPPPLPLATRLAILDQIVAALHHMHARGICHLDVKPCNIMLEHPHLSGSAQLYRLADFGLSQAADGSLMPGRYRGTLPYMAPELAVNLRSVATPALDIWSVGVVMRELVTLTPPCSSWKGDAIKSALRDRTLYAVSPPCEPPYAAMMAQCLSYDPGQRPSALQLRSRIASLIDAEALHAFVLAGVPPVQVQQQHQQMHVPASSCTPPRLPAPVMLPESLGLGCSCSRKIPNLPNSLGICGGSRGSGDSESEEVPQMLRSVTDWQALNLPSSLDLMSFSGGDAFLANLFS
jgi:serine/threonine protein kinase